MARKKSGERHVTKGAMNGQFSERGGQQTVSSAQKPPRSTKVNPQASGKVISKKAN